MLKDAFQARDKRIGVGVHREVPVLVAGGIRITEAKTLGFGFGFEGVHDSRYI